MKARMIMMLETGDKRYSGKILFRLMGIPWTYNAKSWLFVMPKFVIGLIVAFIFLRELPFTNRIGYGLLYGLLLNAILVLHIIGHTISSKWVGAPMDENFITPQLIITTYHDEGEVSKRVHLARAVGGPIMNICLGLAGLMVWFMVGGHVLLYFALANLILVAYILMPIRGVDGEVIWRELRQK